MTEKDRLEIIQAIRGELSPLLKLLQENRLNSQEWLTVEGAGKYTKLSISAVYRLIKREAFPIRRIGRIIRISRTALYEYMQGSGGGKILGGARIPAKALTAG